MLVRSRFRVVTYRFSNTDEEQKLARTSISQERFDEMRASIVLATCLA